MSVPRFSVCIPTYQRPHLIVEAVQSVLQQSYPDFELLVFDNSDSSETEDALRRIRDDRIIYKRHSENIGACANWNALLKHAHADYIKFLNDDDFMEEDCLEIINSHLCRCDDITVAMCRARYISPDGSFLKLDPQLGDGRNYVVSKEHALRMLFYDQLRVGTPTHSVYRRREAIDEGGFKPELRYARDIALGAALAARGGVLSIESKPLVNFRLHQGQDLHLVSVDTRIREQIELKRWMYHVSHHSADSEGILDVLESMIAAKEVAMAIRDKRWSDVKRAMQYWFKSPRPLAGFSRLLSYLLVGPPPSTLKGVRQYI